MPDEFDPLSALSPIERLKLGLELEGRYATPEERAANGRKLAEAALSVTPVIGNAMSARDAYTSAVDALMAAREGRLGAAAGNAGLGALGALGAVSGLPFGRRADDVAREGASRLNVLVPAPGNSQSIIARGMRERGAPNREVFDRTGMVFGHEGRLKQEIPDAPMKIAAPPGVQIGDEMKLGDFADHPELFARMPHLAEQPVRWTDKRNQMGRPVAKTDPTTGVFELNMHVQDLRPDAAKLLQYQIGRDSGFSGTVRHGYDKVKSDIDNAAATARSSGATGEDLDAYLAMLEKNRNFMADTARTKGMATADQFMGIRSGGNIDAKMAEWRAPIEDLEGRFPYARHAAYMPNKAHRRPPVFEDTLVLPPEGASRDDIVRFLANWRQFGSGRGP